MVEKVQEFFFADDTLSKTFESFVKERAGMIDLESSEFKLEYTAVYEEFKSIFEAEIESFIENKLGCSIQRFYNALKSKTDENENSNEAIFAKILLAVCDFDVFMTMMREEAIAISRK
jgi:The ARF-like 2 binding protein BART